MINKYGKVVIIICLIAFICNGNNRSYGQATIFDTVKTQVTKTELIKDDPIVAMLDSLATLKQFNSSTFTTDRNKLNKYKYPVDYSPVFSDSVYIARMAKLNAGSPFELVYNTDVKNYINVYAGYKRKLTERILGLSQIYFPIFEEYLDKYNLPLELKYLAIVESALTPVARSWAGAAGLWQFIYPTGKLYNLNVTSYIDDRLDPIKATRAACEHFIDLYSLYHDWSLVLAAYNSGIGNVNKAIRRAGGTFDFWKIKRFLPKETQGYVPAFIAVNYVMNYSTEHNIFPVAPYIMAYETDTVVVKQEIMLEQVAEVLNLPIENLKLLNPTYKKNIIPCSDGNTYTLRLPKKDIAAYINNEQTIYAHKPFIKTLQEMEIDQYRSDILAKKQIYLKRTNTGIKSDSVAKQNVASNSIAPKYIKKEKTIIHVVRRGEQLKTIARKYNCSPNDIADWNNIRKKKIRTGQKLVIKETYVEVAKAKIIANKADLTVAVKPNDTKADTTEVETAEAKPMPAIPNKVVYHTVQKGDTLWSIANKYKNVTIEDIKKINKLTDATPIKPGQKLKIAVNS